MRRTLFSKSILPLFLARAIISGEIHDPFVAGNILESHLRADPTAYSHARALLSFSPHPSTFMYNTLLQSYLRCNLPSQALHLFDEMLHCDTIPNKHTFPLLLKALTQTGQLQNGASLHPMILKRGLSSDPFVLASLIHFYGSVGCVEDAHHVFDEVSDPSVSAWTALLSSYAKDGSLSLARELFDGMPQRNLVSWSAMISGYVQCRQPGEALVLFRDMLAMKVQPSYSVLVSILVAAAELGALLEGKWVHGFLERSRMSLSSNLKTTLVHMYAKCGDLLSAKQTFERLREKNVDLWNAMIAGLGLHGRGEEALELFRNMVDEGIEPDDMSFICLLSACSHAGMVADGRECFETMSRVYNLEPKVEHYSCMVDLLGKAGLLNEAVLLIQIMPMKPNDRIWGSLFGACRIHGDIGLGEAAGKHLIEMEPHEPGCYVLLANLYASTGRWQDALTVRGIMKIRAVELEPGCSLIEVDGVVHEFLVDDRAHPSANDLYDMLSEMEKVLRGVKYDRAHPISAWVVGRTGRLSMGVKYDPPNGSRGPMNFKDLKSWSCAIGYGLGSSSPLSPSFNFSLELVKKSKLIASFYQHIVVQRRVNNPFEENQVVGITNYIDFGFELATRINEEKSASNVDESSFHIAASWQANKNFLLKGKTGPLSSAVTLAFKSWWKPSFTFSLTAINDRPSGMTSYGFGIRAENIREASYQRADPNYVMLTPNKEHLAEGVLRDFGKRPMFESEINSGNYDRLPSELQPIGKIF